MYSSDEAWPSLDESETRSERIRYLDIFPYINGSYFVRWSTGEANIAGANFVFSADGTSFSASMRDHNDKEWGVITCQR